MFISPNNCYICCYWFQLIKINVKRFIKSYYKIFFRFKPFSFLNHHLHDTNQSNFLENFYFFQLNTFWASKAPLLESQDYMQKNYFCQVLYLFHKLWAIVYGPQSMTNRLFIKSILNAASLRENKNSGKNGIWKKKT